MAYLDSGRFRVFEVSAPYSRTRIMTDDMIQMLKLLYSSKFKTGYYPEVKELEGGRLKRVPRKELKRLATYYKKKLSKAGYDRIMKF